MSIGPFIPKDAGAPSGPVQEFLRRQGAVEDVRQRYRFCIWETRTPRLIRPEEIHGLSGHFCRLPFANAIQWLFETNADAEYFLTAYKPTQTNEVS